MLKTFCGLTRLLLDYHYDYAPLFCNIQELQAFIIIFLVTLESGFFIRSLPYGSQFSPTWNLGSLLGLS